MGEEMKLIFAVNNRAAAEYSQERHDSGILPTPRPREIWNGPDSLADTTWWGYSERGSEAWCKYRPCQQRTVTDEGVPAKKRNAQGARGDSD